MVNLPNPTERKKSFAMNKHPSLIYTEPTAPHRKCDWRAVNLDITNDLAGRLCAIDRR